MGKGVCRLSKHGKSDNLVERSSGPGCTASILSLMSVGVRDPIRDAGSYLQLWLVFSLAEPPCKDQKCGQLSGNVDRRLPHCPYL